MQGSGRCNIVPEAHVAFGEELSATGEDDPAQSANLPVCAVAPIGERQPYQFAHPEPSRTAAREVVVGGNDSGNHGGNASFEVGPSQRA